MGAGPLHSDIARDLAKRVCHLASSVTVRDEGSRAVLLSAGADPARVEAAADLVFAYPPVPLESVPARQHFETPDERKPRIGLALRSWTHGVDSDFWERQVGNALDQWLRLTGGHAVFLPMQTAEGPEDDRLVAQRIIERLSSAAGVFAITDALSPAEARWALGQCDLVIGMRYHAVALAALNGTPLLSISYDPKVRALAAQLGLEHLDHPVHSLRAPELAHAIEEALANGEAITARLAEAVPSLRRSALGAFSSAAAAIEEGTSPVAPDPVMAQSLRSLAVRIRELEPLIGWSRQLETALARAEIEKQTAHAEISAEREHARRERDIARNSIAGLQAQAAADKIARDRIETDFRTVHAWSKAQGAHIKALIADVQEAQRAAAARRFPIPDRAAMRKAIHLALDLIQKITPEGLRRAVRPGYLALYHAVFPAGKREFQRIAPPQPKPLPTARTSTAAPLKSDWPIGTFPLVSVVLPVWNQPELLGAGIRSILNQTYSNLELIVVDDGSTADLVPVVTEFQSDPRFRCIRRPHEGLPRTLSAGFRMARGDFWTWTSADNLAHPEMIETLLAFLLRRPDVDMTFGNMDLIDDRGAPLVHSNYRVHAQRPGATNQLDLPHTVETLGLVNDNFIGACFLYRAEMGRALGPYDDSLLGTEDYDYWLRMQSAGTIAHADTAECLYSYRVHDDSLSGRHPERIARNAEALIEIHRERRAKWVSPPADFAADPEAGDRVSESDMLLARKARDNRYPLWDVPSFNQPLMVYAGPVDDALDWPFLRRLAEAAPHASLLFFSTDERYVEDPRALLSGCDNVIFLGYKRPAEWVSYLSQANVLLAPFTERAGGAAISETIRLYLHAGKPVLATEAVAKSGFRLAPNLTFGDELESALRVAVDFKLTDLYLQTVSPAGRAAQKWKLARARSEAPHPAILERPGPRILLETRSFHRGGLERVVLDMAHWLHLADYPVSVAVAHESGDMSKECEALGVAVANLQDDPARLAALFDRDHPDLLIPHYSSLGPELAWRRGIPVLSIVHNSYIWAGEAMEREIRGADLFVSRYIAVSSSAKDFFSRRFGVNPGKIGIIPNGIDVDRCEEALARPAAMTRAQLGIDPHDTVLLMVGALIGTKAQLHAIAALSRIAPRRRNVRLIIVGAPYDTAYAALLHQTVVNLHLQEVVRILPETDSIFDLYRLADALLCTSLTEGWSLAMTEAMFCGLPVLTTSVGGAPEAIQESGLGIVFPPAYQDILHLNDSNLWAYATGTAPANLHAITEAIDAFCADRETWKSQAAAGGTIVRSRYAKPVIARRYEEEIERLLLEHYGEVHWRRG